MSIKGILLDGLNKLKAFLSDNGVGQPYRTGQ